MYIEKMPARKTIVRPYKSYGQTQAVRGRGKYQSTKQGKGGRHYYSKYKAAKAKSDSGEGWLSSGLGSIGNMLLPGIGGGIGRGLGGLIKTVTGFGDYQVVSSPIQSNTLLETNSPPNVENTRHGKCTVIRHREFIKDIISHPTPGQFSLENFYVQPGDFATFPWLASIASNYEHYEIRGMLFEFKTMSSDALNSTNTALGQVIMACNYNAALPNFTSKFEMENYEYAVSIKPSQSTLMPLECERSQSVLGDLYVRPAGLPAGQDRRLYDFGNFQIATNGLQGTSVNVGEMWISYEIAFFKPKIWDALGNNNLFASYSNAVQTGIDQTHPFGTIAMTPSPGNTMDIDVQPTQLIFDPDSVYAGDWLLTVNWKAAAAAYAVAAPTLAATNIAVSSLEAYPTIYNTTCNSLSLRIFLTFDNVVSIPGAAATLAFTFASSPPAGAVLEIDMIQIPSQSV